MPSQDTLTAAPPIGEVSPVTRALSEHIAGALARPLPDEVAEKARHHLLDTLAAMISGARLKAGRLAIGYVRRLGGRREATVVGSRLVTGAISAALANAMSAHADETDDSHLGGRWHPGCGVVPAALALAELKRRPGADLLKAVVLGYDVGSRANLSLGLTNPNNDSHSTHSTGALFGAAAASAALMGFDARRTRHLLSYTVQQASGVPCWHRDPEHVEKAFDFGGMGARNAVAAATMVEAGLSGVDDPFAGTPSFFTCFAENPRPEALTEGLGTRFEIMAASIKKWCVGSPIQAAVDAAVALMRDHGLRADAVGRLTITLPDDRMHIVDDRAMPDVCVQHLVALTLLDGDLGFAAAHDHARMADPAVRALRARMTLVGSRELTHAKPARQAILEVVTVDGRTLVERTRAVRGTPDNPMPRAEVEAKAVDLLAPLIGAERTRALIDQVWRITALDDVRALRPLLQA